jgi:endo-1,4-beta-D-glucanase Y
LTVDNSGDDNDDDLSRNSHDDDGDYYYYYYVLEVVGCDIMQCRWRLPRFWAAVFCLQGTVQASLTFL